MFDFNESRLSNKRPTARGAVSNAVGRFEPYTRERVDDGWPVEAETSVYPTEVAIEKPRSVVNYVKSPDLRFDRTLNPYRGCEHGCIYCYARPSHAYLDLSPGLDFETKLVARPTTPDILRKTLSKKSYEPNDLSLGTNTDPYQPIEKKYEIMRGILEVMREYNHPIQIVTKGALILRDVDILADLARDNLVRVGISLTTLDRKLSRKMEPRVPTPLKRLEMIEKLSMAGVPVRAMISPLIPALTDHELEGLMKAARERGATTVAWTILRLPREVHTLFQEWLDVHEKGRAQKVMNRVRETHGGRDYDPDWHKRMRGQGLYAGVINERFKLAKRKLGYFDKEPPLDKSRFRDPDTGRQMSLF